MGFDPTLKRFPTLLLLIFFLLLVSLSWSIYGKNEIHFKPPAAAATKNPKKQATQYQVFYVKNTTPFFLNRQEFNRRPRRRSSANRMMKRKKIFRDNFRARTFSVMLPKGFVPPSGSSPCHNDKPDSSVAFYCGLSATEP